MEFENKMALITGGTDGIGLAIAESLASKGCNLILLARKKEKLALVKKNLEQKHNVRVSPYQCDISNANQVRNTFDEIKKYFPTIHFLVNNAGYTTSKSIETITEEEFDKEIAVFLKGTYLITMQTYPFMKEGGAIVNIGSAIGSTGSKATSPAYAAAKAGVINLTKTFAYQLAKYNIRVNCVSPGGVYPTGFSLLWNNKKKEAKKNATLFKRVGTPEEIANPVYFLLSDLSSYITGHTLNVNGGEYMN